MVKLYHTIRRFTPCPSHWANAININFEHLSREKARAKVAEIRVLPLAHYENESADRYSSRST
jgi:hypothetical protein